MLDWRFQPVECTNFLQPAIGLAQLFIDLLEARNVGMFMWRLCAASYCVRNSSSNDTWFARC